MAHNFLSKGQLKNFIQNRKKLDDQIGELLGPDIHLHDISQQQTPKSIQRIVKSKPEIPVANLPKPNKKKSQKYQNYFMNYENEDKSDKLYKENIELQKKIMAIRDQNQNYKHKAILWNKMKQYILYQVNQQIRLKSIRYCSSDIAILEEFIKALEDIFSKNKQVSKVKNGSQKDHSACRQLQQQTKKKLEQQSKKVTKLFVQMEALKGQNFALKQRQNTSIQQRRARMSQIQTGIQYKFQQIQKSLQQKTQQNNILLKKIANLQFTILQLRNQNSPLRKKDKTISTNFQSISDKSQLDYYKKIAKGKDEQINKLKKQGQFITNQMQSLQTYNQKMKRVILMAQKMNNQFLQKLQESFKKKQTFNDQVSTQYNLPRFDKGFQISQDFHMTNKRFKIVKSRSVEKQRYMYGTATFNKI